MIEGAEVPASQSDLGSDVASSIPREWEMRRLRTITSIPIRNGLGESARTYQPDWPRYIRITDIDGPRSLKSAGVASLPPDVASCSMVGDGDLLLAAVGATVGKSYLHRRSGVPACFAGYLVRLALKAEALPEYVSYWTESDHYWLQVETSAVKATIENLSASRYRRFVIPLPPPEVQAAVVRYLDHIDSRIQRFIAAKERLIELLEEEKRAIIHRAVTRGLDPDAPLRHSGIDAIGRMPAHWQVKPLQQVTEPKRPIMYGIVLPGPDVDEGVYIVKGGNCEPGRLRPELLSKTTHEIESRYARSRLRENDIVIAIRGGVGASELVPQDLIGANLTQDAARIAPKAGVSPRWLLNALREHGTREQIVARVRGATVRGINIRDLKRIPLPVPPREEQVTIAGYLERELHAVGQVEGRASAHLRLIREYRTRLVSDVVTGKLDVRAAARHLPADPEIDVPELDEELEEAVA